MQPTALGCLLFIAYIFFIMIKVLFTNKDFDWFDGTEMLIVTFMLLAFLVKA